MQRQLYEFAEKRGFNVRGGKPQAFPDFTFVDVP